MFPLKKRIIGGYKFRERTFYHTQHLGVDYRAVYEPLYAPKDGVIISQSFGPQGGNTIAYTPNGEHVVMRFMHLSKFSRKPGLVKKGDLIGITGNTGAFTTAPHLHLDISKNRVNIYNINNFIDPELYNWK
jgi:murein DD-endopeptidase MepM/ murein hydrolase activator NlpD